MAVYVQKIRMGRSPAPAMNFLSAVSRSGSTDPNPGRRGLPGAGRRPVSVKGMRTRLCSKVGCAREAVTTLTYDYGDQMAAVLDKLDR